MKVLYAPEGGGAAAATTDAPGTAEPAKSATEAPKSATNVEPAASDAPQRPEWLPEKFRDPAELATSYKELEGRMRTRTDDLKRGLAEEVKADLLRHRPESPDKYALELPEGALPEGMEFKPNTDDPLYRTFREVAYEHGIPQATFSRLVSAYVESIGSMLPDRAAEIAKLGENGRDRLDAAMLWAQANVPERQREWLISVSDRAEAVEFVEWARTVAGDPRQGDRTSSAVPNGPPPSADELRAMQGDPRYYDPRRRDKDFVRKVDEGYRHLAASMGKR
jgi:hypothetical protein